MIISRNEGAIFMEETRKSKTDARKELYECLNKLDIKQWKIFYAAFVHYWVNHKFFISKQSFFNLWCELNLLCHELDESFPDQYDDHEAVKDFCHFHPYYFIDRLPLDIVAGVFADHVDNRIDILSAFAKTLHETDIRSAYTHISEALGLDESIDYLVSETETHIKFFR